MKTGAFKAAISDSERKILLLLGMLALLLGVAGLGNHAMSETYAPLAILLGLFGICVGVVKAQRSLP